MQLESFILSELRWNNKGLTLWEVHVQGLDIISCLGSSVFNISPLVTIQHPLYIFLTSCMRYFLSVKVCQSKSILSHLSEASPFEIELLQFLIKLSTDNTYNSRGQSFIPSHWPEQIRNVIYSLHLLFAEEC